MTMTTERKRSYVASLLLEDGNACFYCYGPMLLTRPPDQTPDEWAVNPDRHTLEHLVDRSKRGIDHYCNLKLAHRECNMARAGMLYWPKMASRGRRIP